VLPVTELSSAGSTDSDSTTTPAAGTTSSSEENTADTLASEKGVWQRCMYVVRV
jgi:hypothetical protein